MPMLRSIKRLVAITAPFVSRPEIESTTTRLAGGLDFTAIGGKRQGREVPQSLRVEPGAKHPVWKTQSMSRTWMADNFYR